MRLSLQAKILLLLAGTAVGLASVILLSLAFLANRQINQAVRADVRATGGMLAQLVEDRSRTLRDQSLLLAKQPVLKAVIGTNDVATVTDSARDYQKQIHADAVVVTDRDGRVLGESDLASPPSTHREPEPGCRSALHGDVWTGVVARRNRLMLSVSVPVLIHGEVWGTFTAYRAIDPGVAQDLHTALGTDVAFVYQGRVVGSSRPLPARLPTPRGIPRLVTLKGSRFFALYAPLPHTGPNDRMGFVTLRSYDRAMAPYNRSRVTFAGIFAVTLLLALAAGTILARSLTRPLQDVVQAARVIRQGEWPAGFDVRRSDEIGLLQNVFNDMTAAVRDSQERLLALLHIDPLTELDNHRSFQERLAQEARRCARSGEPLSLVLMDLDHFQQYNQRHGHASGDDALRQTAGILREMLPDVAILARYAGDEFAALLPQHELAQAEALAEQVRRAVFELWGRQGGGQPLSLSLGCAEFGTHTAEPEGLVLASELALSRAKQLGRNCLCRFDSVPGADETADPYHLHWFLKDESLATIQALAAAVDAKDPYTQGHSQSVASYASDLAQFIGLPQAEVDLIHTAGTLHDVGKIGVPDAILKKPGRLDEEERRVMETHPVLGEVIIRKAPALAPILPGVRHHHERWDGQGYPDRLAGEEIPRMARLLAVADTFDAMTSDRPYRKGLPLEVALEEIARHAGTQFEPELAHAFVALLQGRGALARAA